MLAMRAFTSGFRAFAVLGLLGFAASAGAAPTAPVPMSQPIACQIKAEPASGMLRIQAVARAQSAASGRYALAVSKMSASGTSRTMQSGAVSLAPGEEQVLTTVFLEASAAGHFRAELTLDTDLGRVECASP